MLYYSSSRKKYFSWFFFSLLLIVSLIHESCGVFRFFFVLENIFERFIHLNCPLLRESVKVKPPVHINIEISREVTRLVKFSINVFEHMYMLEP